MKVNKKALPALIFNQKKSRELVFRCTTSTRRAGRNKRSEFKRREVRKTTLSGIIFEARTLETRAK